MASLLGPVSQRFVDLTGAKMQRVSWILILLCACPAFAQSEADRSKQVKYTKYQLVAAGFWRVTALHTGGNVQWLVIGLGDSGNTMTVRWPTGLGCQIESADIRGDTITVAGDHFPAVIKISGRKTATLSMFGGQTILPMTKTKEATEFGCE